jgi:hypothetical protein
LALALGDRLRAEQARLRDLRERLEAHHPRDVIARLRASEAGRMRDMLGVRYTKMAASPFAYLRGNAWVMAPDLAALPVTGYMVQVCGDAHVRNLGAYAAQDGRVVFDVNDFDESCIAPFEWELTRLAVSIVVVAREAGASDGAAREAVCAMVRTWRETLDHLVALPVVELARYCVHRYQRDDAVGQVIRHAERVTPQRAVEELAAPGKEKIELMLRRLIVGESRISDVHDVRVRRNSEGLFVHYHCRFDPAETIETVHDIIDRIETELQHEEPRIKRVIAHAEPVGPARH